MSCSFIWELKLKSQVENNNTGADPSGSQMFLQGSLTQLPSPTTCLKQEDPLAGIGNCCLRWRAPESFLPLPCLQEKEQHTFLLLCNKSPKSLRLKTTEAHKLTVCRSEAKAPCSWVLGSRSHRRKSRSWLAVISPDAVRSTPRSPGCGRTWFLTAVGLTSCFPCCLSAEGCSWKPSTLLTMRSPPLSKSKTELPCPVPLPLQVSFQEEPSLS